MGQNGLLVSELSWRLVIDLLVPFKIKGLKTARGKSATISAMKRTLNTTINRSKNEKNDERYTQLADIENGVRQNRGHYA